MILPAALVSAKKKTGVTLQELQSVIFETNFADDTGFSLTAANNMLWRYQGASPPQGWDGMMATGAGKLETVSNGAGGNAMKFEWDAANAQPTLRLMKQISGNQNTGYDELYIRYNVKLPNAQRFGPTRDYWKWGRIWQNINTINDASVTENKPDSGYVVWQCGSGQGFTRFASYWQDAGPNNDAGLGSAGGESQITNFYVANADVNTQPGYFESVGGGAWDLDNNGDLTDQSQEFHTLEFHFKLSTSPTANDGVFEIYMDGTLWSWQTLQQAYGAPVRTGLPTHRLTSGWNLFGLFDNMGGWNSEWDQPGVDGYVLIDDIVISRNRIGHTYVASNTDNTGVGAA